MTTAIWIAIIGTLASVAAFANAVRLRRNTTGAGAILLNAHMLLAVLFIPVVWFIALPAVSAAG